MSQSVTASGAQWTISRENQTAVVVEVGGGIRGYQVCDEEVVDGFGEGEIPPGAAGQILAPWPNRLRDGAFRFNGELHQLPLSEPSLHNAIHGLVRWVSWQPVERAENSITMEHILHPQPGYPWRLLLHTRYALEEDGLRVAHAVHNLSDRPAPFGLGTHPYVRVPGVPLAETKLCIKARIRLLLDGRLLPIGAARVAGGEWDYSTPRRIGSAPVNGAFGDVWRGEDGKSEVTVSAPDGRSIRVWADAAFPWWQLYTGDALAGDRNRRSIAIEPMTCPPDALRSGRDLITLDPGGSWSGEWGITAAIGPDSNRMPSQPA